MTTTITTNTTITSTTTTTTSVLLNCLTDFVIRRHNELDSVTQQTNFAHN